MESKNKKELTSLLSTARNFFIETDNKWEHAGLDKMRSMMGNNTTHKQIGFGGLATVLLYFIILYLVALMGSMMLGIPLDSFYGEVFNYLLSGNIRVIEVSLIFICITIISIILYLWKKRTQVMPKK